MKPKYLLATGKPKDGEVAKSNISNPIMITDMKFVLGRSSLVITTDKNIRKLSFTMWGFYVSLVSIFPEKTNTNNTNDY